MGSFVINKKLITFHVSDIAEEISSHQQANLQRSDDTNKYSCSAIRLNNNGMCDLERFAEVMSDIVENIDDIAWLDLSFNELETIDKVCRPKGAECFSSNFLVHNC